VESLADMTPEQLEAIEGIGPKTVEKISIAVNNYFAGLDGGEAVAATEEETAGEGATESALTEAGESEIAVSEEQSSEGTVEADALDAEAGNAGEVESPAEGELVAATLAEVADSVEAEPVEAEPAEENSEAATEAAATEEAPEDKKS
jgi:N utilization substance protein A